MKILVFGEIGQLGQELIRRAGDVTLEVRGLDEADFTQPETCVAFVNATDADAVINAVAYTAVDKAEDDEPLAHQINAATPTALARAAADRGLPFVHVSTDYVFDGDGETPFTPDHPPAPKGAYGRTKLDGERGVQAAGGPHAILRTSWVVSAHGHNFIKTMLDLGRKLDALSIVCDQIGGPTPAAALADACLAAARGLLNDPSKTGIYHVAGGPDTSWAGFAREIFAQAGIDCDVGETTTAAYAAKQHAAGKIYADRPLNSRMDCTTLETVLGMPRPDWRAGLTDILKDLGEI